MPSINDLLLAFNVPRSVPVRDTRNEYDGKIDKTTVADAPLYRGPLGTPVVSDVVFPAGNYTSNTGQLVTFSEVKLMTVLLTVDQAKKIIKTEIQGRDGTVKEYIGMGDYDISIDGILTGGNGHYPVDEVQALKRVLDAPIPLKIVSRYLHNLDVFNVVVESYNFPQTAGGYSQQPYSIKCISDAPVELIIV